MPPKPIYQSRTAWLQVITLFAAFIPPVQAFLVTNPVASVAVLSAVNILVRFVSQGKVTLFADGQDAPANPSGGALAWFAPLVLGITAAGLGMALPSCSPAQISAAESIPIHATAGFNKGSIGYDSATGISINVDATSGK